MDKHNELRIAVCDDDAADLNIITSYITDYLNKTGHTIQIDEFSSGASFLASDTDRYGIVFLDIFMEGINGMETAKKLFSENTRTKIVFCSSSAEFGVESYDVKAIRYLVKPIQKDRIFDILDHFFHVYTTLRTITVKVGRTEEDIYVNSILWIESDRHNCIIHTKSGKTVTRATFAQLRAQLPNDDFVQPIRYALVNISAVTVSPSTELTLEDGTVIPIVREARDSIKRAYVDYCWKKMYE